MWPSRPLCSSMHFRASASPQVAALWLISRSPAVQKLTALAHVNCYWTSNLSFTRTGTIKYGFRIIGTKRVEIAETKTPRGRTSQLSLRLLMSVNNDPEMRTRQCRSLMQIRFSLEWRRVNNTLAATSSRRKQRKFARKLHAS